MTISRFLPMKRLVAIILVLAACSDSGPTGTTNLPLTGTFSGNINAGASRQFGFVAGRSGSTIIKICSAAGTNFDVAVGSASAATSSNCERLVFDATAGTSYTIVVTATSGAGTVNGCWSTALSECTVTAPPPLAVACSDPGYYAAVSGQTGTALIQTLASIISTNANLGYLTTPNARDSLYAFVDDPDGDDQITDIYTGRTETVNSRATAAAAGFNTEHLWPQSRGADIDFASGSDLNILATADTMANRIRSNLPFGIVQNVQATAGTGANASRVGFDAQGRLVFEPRASARGNVARAIFYFYTRYNAARPPGYSLANFNVEEATLLQWAAADPPDQFERDRNAMVCRAQGNRNPFVDHPEYLAAIGDFPNS